MKSGMFASYTEAIGFLVAGAASIRRNRLGDHVGNLEADMTNEKYDWFGWLIITAIVFTVLGYAWAWHHGKIQLKRAHDKGYEACTNELEVVICEEVCQ